MIVPFESAVKRFHSKDHAVTALTPPDMPGRRSHDPRYTTIGDATPPAHEHAGSMPIGRLGPCASACRLGHSFLATHHRDTQVLAGGLPHSIREVREVIAHEELRL